MLMVLIGILVFQPVLIGIMVFQPVLLLVEGVVDADERFVESKLLERF